MSVRIVILCSFVCELVNAKSYISHRANGFFTSTSHVNMLTMKLATTVIVIRVAMLNMRLVPSVIAFSFSLVPPARLELARHTATDFKSVMSTIPSQGQLISYLPNSSLPLPFLAKRRFAPSRKKSRTVSRLLWTCGFDRHYLRI